LRDYFAVLIVFFPFSFHMNHDSMKNYGYNLV
jgi:hypothetical protein